jgi:hypothetical protein
MKKLLLLAVVIGLAAFAAKKVRSACGSGAFTGLVAWPPSVERRRSCLLTERTRAW